MVQDRASATEHPVAPPLILDTLPLILYFSKENDAEIKKRKEDIKNINIVWPPRELHLNHKAQVGRRSNKQVLGCSSQKHHAWSLLDAFCLNCHQHSFDISKARDGVFILLKTQGLIPPN